MTNVKISILKDNYPQDKLSEKEQDLILTEVMVCLFRSTSRDKLPQFRSYRLEGNAFIYICADQQTGHWLIEATDGHKLGEPIMLKETDAKDLPRSVKMALRIWNE